MSHAYNLIHDLTDEDQMQLAREEMLQRILAARHKQVQERRFAEDSQPPAEWAALPGMGEIGTGGVGK